MPTNNISNLLKNTFIIFSAFTILGCTENQTEQKNQPVSTTIDSQTDFSYTAFGSEPDWHIQVAKDNSLTFSTPEIMDGIKLNAERAAYAKGVDYSGIYNNKPFVLSLSSKACKDTMADKSYDMTAIFEFDGNNYLGCAEEK